MRLLTAVLPTNDQDLSLNLGMAHDLLVAAARVILAHYSLTARAAACQLVNEAGKLLCSTAHAYLAPTLTKAARRSSQARFACWTCSTCWPETWSSPSPQTAAPYATTGPMMRR